MHKRSHIYRHKFYTFDIETTTIITGIDASNDPILNGIIWSGQFYDGLEYTQVRDLKAVIKTIQMIEEEAKDFNGDKICIFVHNLSYEFQFIKDFFEWKHIICTSQRKIISAETDYIIFRCTYFLSNMNLEKFMINEHVPEEFLKTNMDYEKERYPWTDINEDEYEYCANDVIGLHKAVQKRIEDCANRDINNLPMTSTGYVRKDCRKAMSENKYNRSRFKREQLSLEYFKLMHLAFRGGNTHGNRYYVNKVMQLLGQKDVRSEYPAMLLLFDYPTKFFEMKPFKQSEFDFYLKNEKKWAMLIQVTWKNIRLKDPEAVPVPYLSISKCKNVYFHDDKDIVEVDNGRILSAAFLSTTITEQDYLIIKDQYEWDENGEAITRVLFSKKKPISKELKAQILDYYYKKTTLKQDEESPDFNPDIDYLYKKSKNKLNGIYGMHVTLPIKPEFMINNLDTSIFLQYPDEDEEREIYAHSVYRDPSKSEEELLDDYYNSFSSFLSYQVGVWVTAYARRHLEKGIKCCLREENGKMISDLVYCDTDSCKYLNPEIHENGFKVLNKQIEALAEKRSAYIDYQGKRFYLGIFDSEGTALRFKTFGAKKYMYSFMKKDKKTGKEYEDFKITISGVPKKKGKECIEKDIKKGRLKDPFDICKGYVFHSVKMASAYNDYKELQSFTCENGKKVYFGSNVAMYPASYTLGLTHDYERLLDQFKDYM